MSAASLNLTAADLERQDEVADAARRSPFWPFGERTPMQLARIEAQLDAYRAGVLVKHEGFTP